MSSALSEISYVYSLHGKLRSDFLGGAIVDALREVLGDNLRLCFSLTVDENSVSEPKDSSFETCGEGRFRLKT
jgi:hypothetical protein